MTIKYLAYGSNLHPERIGERLGRSFAPEHRGELRGHSLRFHKRSFKDGSGKCSAYKTGDPLDVVHGVVYSMSADEKLHLDRLEGLGRGYEEAEVMVTVDSTGEGAFCKEVTALAYISSQAYIDARLKVFTWYKAYVLAGAIYHGFPKEYIEMIEGVETVIDPDLARGRAETEQVERLTGGGYLVER